ncbi:MAG: hypothetical protein U0638_10475 [Phycisphaerales bacterium]
MAFLMIVLCLAWLCALVGSIAASVSAFQRWGRVRGLWSLLCPLGVMLFFDLIIEQFTTYAPNPVTGQTARLGPFLESLALALLGIAVAITGWVKTHPRVFPEGCCQKCGYELNDLPRCPECGTPSLDAPRTASDQMACDPGGPSQEG